MYGCRHVQLIFLSFFTVSILIHSVEFSTNICRFVIHSFYTKIPKGKREDPKRYRPTHFQAKTVARPNDPPCPQVHHQIDEARFLQ